MAIVVSQQDPRFETLKSGHNLRWPEDSHDAAGRIYLCEDAGEVAEALQQAVSAGQRCGVALIVTKTSWLTILAASFLISAY
jgi:hypothetical protein